MTPSILTVQRNTLQSETREEHSRTRDFWHDIIDDVPWRVMTRQTKIANFCRKIMTLELRLLCVLCHELIRYSWNKSFYDITWHLVSHQKALRNVLCSYSSWLSKEHNTDLNLRFVTTQKRTEPWFFRKKSQQNRISCLSCFRRVFPRNITQNTFLYYVTLHG